MLLPVRVRVLLSSLVSPPVPLMSLAIAMLSERLICSVPLLITAPVPSVPVVPALPTSSVPAEMVVVPV